MAKYGNNRAFGSQIPRSEQFWVPETCTFVSLDPDEQLSVVVIVLVLLLLRACIESQLAAS